MDSAPLALTGISLRTSQHADFLAVRPKVAWVEAHSETYFGEGGKALHALERIRQHYPVSLHGNGLSLGSADELNWQHLKKLRELIQRIKPCLISDYLAWSSINGQYLHNPLPLPYTEEALTHVVARVQQVQQYLNKQILITNIANYNHHEASTIPEANFLTEVAKRAGCGILLDITNLYISANNLHFDAQTYLTTLPKELIQEVHLAGFSTTTVHGKEILIDSRNHAIVPAIWDLYRYAVQRLGRKPTIIAWDTNLPTLDVLFLEAYRAEKILRESYVTTKLTG